MVDRLQQALAQANVLKVDLDQLVIRNVLQSLLRRQDARRNQLTEISEVEERWLPRFWYGRC